METQLTFTTQGLVIKELNVGEIDRLVTIFTKEYGILKAYASGVKSIKSKRASGCSLLTYSSFTIKRKGENYRITEAEPISSFFTMGMDVEVLSLCQYFCELSLVFVERMIPNEEFLRLILNSLHFISTGKKNPYLIKAITELRIATIAGYMPDLIACEGCGMFEDDIMLFRLTDGKLFCRDCDKGDLSLFINKTMLKAMRHIVFSEFNNLYSFDIPEEAAKNLSDLTEKYIKIQTEHNYLTLDFLYSII